MPPVRASRGPAKAKKRRRLGESTAASDKLKAELPNHVWAFDFQHDATHVEKRVCRSTDSD